MTPESSNTARKILEYLPKSGPSFYIFIAAIIMAFSLGWIFSGNDLSKHDHNLQEQVQTAGPSAWTCSMHPQIKLPDSGKCPICFMDLIPVVNSGDDELRERELKMSKTAVELAKITTTPVIRDFATAEIRLSGKINFDETRLAYIAARVPGRIDKLFVNYTGTTVDENDPMVQLYSPELLSARQELIQAKLAFSKVNSNSSPIFQSTLEATLEAAREKLRLLGLSSNQIEAMDSPDEPTDHINLYAPIGGTVIHMNAKEGVYVKTGTPIYTIADLSTVWVLFDAYETDLVWLNRSQEIEFESLAMPGDKYKGKISFIDPIINDQTRSVKVRVIADNANGKLKPGMFVTGVVKSQLDLKGNIVSSNDKENSSAPLLIPATAPLLTGQRAVVYLQVSDNDKVIFEGREIELGAKAGDYYIVKSGLSEGELVVTNGAFKLDSELQIQARPSMMNPKEDALADQHLKQKQPQDKSDYKNVELQTVKTSQESLTELSPVYENYFEIQMALADDELPGATESYTNLLKSVKAVKISAFEGESHITWMDLSSEIIKYSELGAKAVNIQKAREAFRDLSTSIIDLNKKLGHGGHRSYYLTYCPMAFNNKGAHWLQTVDTVYNSFYGDQMLRCGSIKDTLKPR